MARSRSKPVTSLALPPLRRGARFDPSRRYRYWLWRTWDPDQPRLAFCMLNPSTADAIVDDPTIYRCMQFSYLWGYGGIVVVNIFAFRTPHPSVLRTAAEPVGAHNDRYILDARSRTAGLVLAWGNHGNLLERSAAVRKLLGRGRKPVWCLGVTKSGEPHHPLYLPLTTTRKRFEL